MRKVLLAILLAVVSGNAAAEWVLVESDRGNTYYADPDTVRRVDNMVTILELADLNKPRLGANGKPYLSTTTQIEYDCDKARHRMLSLRATSGNMEQGDIVSDFQFVDEWQPVPESSVASAMKAYACGVKNGWHTAGMS